MFDKYKINQMRWRYEAIPARARDLSLRTPHSTYIENNLDEGLNDIDWINTHTQQKNSFSLETADGWMSAVPVLAATTSGANDDSSRRERESAAAVCRIHTRKYIRRRRRRPSR